MHFNDSQTLSLRIVDPIAEEGAWASKTMDVTVAVMAKSGDKMLKQKSKSCAFNPSAYTERQLLSIVLERARQVERQQFQWQYDCKSPTW